MERRQMKDALNNPRRSLLKASSMLAAVGVGAGVAAPAIAQKKVRWRMGLCWPKNAPGLATPAIRLSEFIKKATNGEFEIELYGAGEMVPALQTFDAVLDGTLDCGHGYPSYWAGKSPAMNLIMSTPFGMNAQEKTAWLFYGGGLDIIDKVYRDFDAKFLPLGNCGIQPLGWFKNEIKSLQDLQGLKFRVSGLCGEVLRECGVAVVGLPAGEILQALQSGALDGAELTGPFVDQSFGLHRVAKNYYFPGWHEPEGQFELCINAGAYEALSDQHKELLRVGAYYAHTQMLSEIVAHNGPGFKRLQEEEGVKARLLRADVLKRFSQISKDLIAADVEKSRAAKEVWTSIEGFLESNATYSEWSEGLFMNVRAKMANRELPAVS